MVSVPEKESNYLSNIQHDFDGLYFMPDSQFHGFVTHLDLPKVPLHPR
jgi:hypothetical protein